MKSFLFASFDISSCNFISSDPRMMQGKSPSQFQDQHFPDHIANFVRNQLKHKVSTEFVYMTYQTENADETAIRISLVLFLSYFMKD